MFGNQHFGPTDLIHAHTYTTLEDLSIKEGSCALHRITFLETPAKHHQHLDIGCGPGTFTRDFLASRSMPCATLVAVDQSPLMIDFAKRYRHHDNVTFDVFDFGGQDVQQLIGKYGCFDRIYSFLWFHFVKDQRKAYADLSKMLAPASGECVIFSSVWNIFTDVWLQVHLMERWRQVIPDPRPLFSLQYKFDFDGQLDKIEAEVRALVAEAGLETIACHVFQSEWPFPTVEVFVGLIFEAFGFYEAIPEEDIEAVKRDWVRLVQSAATTKSNRFAAKAAFYCVHARARP
ncbi:uncharacterized protein LOC119452959 [Dermacentor silvarum]|uniref:uncharacterized protein LOC119452959 n=1 Tax=Dermacentor silvarum TaxID=543639 RepID=UPI001897626B|nr:uncharacterized protein LOC119452959 [Dermacentor silvarum]